jgi:hypothetical protein
VESWPLEKRSRCGNLFFLAKKQGWKAVCCKEKQRRNAGGLAKRAGALSWPFSQEQGF